MLIGVYGLIFEFTSPGAVAPGVIGTICLLLGLYALNLLPINYAGLALMLLGIAFLVVEAFNPTVVLGLGGVAAFLLGAAMLFKVEAPGYQLSWTVIGHRRGDDLRPGRLRRSACSGAPAEARRGSARRPCAACRPKSSTGPAATGHVLPMASAGRPRATEAFAPGETVEVADVKGLTLMVRRRPARTASEGERAMMLDYLRLSASRGRRGHVSRPRRSAS